MAGAVDLPEVQLALGQAALDRGDLDGAFGWFAAAARSGDPRAVNMLGRAYERGWGTAPDSRRAAALYRTAHLKGDVWAAFNLADLMMRGDGLAKDEAGAAALYLAAARRGHLKSLNMLGVLHEDGRALPRDPVAAEAYFRAGTDGGDGWAAFNLGRLCLGDGRIGEARAAFGRAVRFGIPDLLRHVVDALDGHPDPVLAALARQAGDRLGAVAPSPALPDVAGSWR